MIKITLEYATIEAAITAMAMLRSGDAKVETTKDAATAGKSDGAKSKTKSTEPAATADKPTASAETAAAQQTQPAASSVPYSDVSAAIVEAAKTHRSEVVALLGSMGAKSAKELKPEQYAEFLGKLAEATKVEELA